MYGSSADIVTRTVEIRAERIVNQSGNNVCEYIHTRYTILHNGAIVLETLDFAAALQSYINRVIV